MVGGIDRYFQIARCLRDEDLRADRQYEFMQLDAEMSFVDQDDVLAAISEAVLDAAEAVTGERPPTIARITWHEAMDRYGVDKPDLRFGMELVELTDGVRGHRVQGLRRRGVDQGHPGAGQGRGATAATSSTRLTDRAKQLGAKGLVWMKVGDERRARVARSPSSCPTTEQAGAASRRSAAEPGDLLLLVADEWTTTVRGARAAAQRPRPAAGARGPVPLRVGRRLPDVRRRRRATGSPKPGHHPFTRPHPDDIDKLESDPHVGALAAPTTSCSTAGSSAPARSGSTSPSCSSASSTCSASPRRRPTGASGSSSTPFRYGAPPHGGFAFGIDRLVAILAGEENIREVIAFPKPQSGIDPMTGAPTPVAPAQLAELGLRTLPPSS